MILDIGCHSISGEEYHADPCIEPSLSRSTIKALLYKSPAHARWGHPRLNPDYAQENGKEAFDIGTAAHSLLLEGIDNIVVVEAEDWRGKEAKGLRDQAYTAGKTPLLLRHYSAALSMVQSARNQIAQCTELGVMDLQEGGDSELTYIWKEGGAYCRIRPDWISKDKGLIIDYKTTSASANPAEWARTAISTACDIQEAFYRRGVKAIDGKEPAFIFVVQETYPPYLCSFIGLPPDFSAMGKSKCDYGLFLWEQCMKSQRWPGYPNQVAWVDLPGYAAAAWETRATSIGE